MTNLKDKASALLSIVFCAFWFTTQQAADLAYNSPKLWNRIQLCMTENRDEWHYTDKCISKAFPNKTLLVDQECTMFEGRVGCVPVVKLIRNGNFIFN